MGKSSKKRPNYTRNRKRGLSNIKNLPETRYFYDSLAFLLPAAILLGAYISMGIFPFGERATMIIDSYHQYVPFFSELHDKIWSGDSLLYSWHGSLGFNFLAVQAYYLASPLNFLIALFPSSMMIEAFEFLICLKICLSGLTAFRYLRFRTGKNDFSAAVFAGFYALGGFTIAYNWNVMWLDSIVLFPLVVMGVEKFIENGEWRLYTVMMGLTIFVNYYMAIMVCIFVVLYFFVVWLSKKRGGIIQLLGTGVRFAGCSLLAGGLAGVYLFPTYYTLINSSQGSSPTKLEFYRDVFELIRQQFAFVEPTQLTGAPNIYCGILTAMLVLFYAVAADIGRREKIARLLVTGFVLLSLNLNVLDYVWHGFHFPNNLPGRFSFIYIFMVVSMAYEAWQTLRQTDRRLYVAFFVVEAALFGLCIWYPDGQLPMYSMVVTGLFMGVYMLLLAAHRQDMWIKIKKFKIYPMQICLLLMIVEMTGNTVYGLNMNGTVNRTNYVSDQQEVAEIRETYEATDTFYRMELAQTRGRDDVTWHHLSGLSFFSSTADDRMEKLIGALGFYNAGNKYTYKGATPLTDALLAIRYIISNDEMTAPNLSLSGQTENKYIYENENCLSVGYMVDADVLDWNIVEGEPFSIQNDFVRQATDVENALFTALTVPQPEVSGGEITSTEDDKWYYDSTSDDGELVWQLVFDEQCEVYVYFEASHCESMEVIIDGEKETYTDQRGHIVYIGQCDAGKVVTLNFPMDSDYSSGNVKLQVYAYHSEVFEEVYGELSANQLEVIEYDSTSLTGSIDVDEDGVLMLSIPYDEGWTILVDGEETEYQAVGEALIGCYLSAGSHTVEMRYVPQGFRAGLLLTIVSLAILGTGLYLSHRRKSVIK